MAGDERERVARLIEFLADLDAIRNPPVYDIATYGVYVLREPDLISGQESVRLDTQGTEWLTVDFVDVPPVPEVPLEIAELLDPAEVRDSSRLLTARVLGNEETDSEVEDSVDRDLSEAEHALLALAQDWIDRVWTPWAESHVAALTVKRLYRDLFEQRDKLNGERESVELVWGFGRLRWNIDDKRVDHPLLTVPMEIERALDSGRISAVQVGQAEVETRWLAGLPVSDREGFLSIRQQASESGVDPWSSDALGELTHRLLRAIDQQNRGATVDPQWVLYIRRRRPDYQGFLDQMQQLYRDGSCPIPDPLRAVISDAPSALALAAASPPADGEAWESGLHEQLLLPLPTNEEQQRIVRLAQSRSGVTVQGPPGTGKSHTIANIISHYVAHGRRVLVVAEKEQALRTLAEKIPEGIRDLTVSALGADADSRRGLESSIKQIQTRVTGLDKFEADQRIAQLRVELDEIDRRIASATNRLLATREAEVTTLPGVWAAGTDPSPAQAARWVADNAPGFGYIDDELDPATAQPLTIAELVELRTLIEKVGFDRAAASAQYMPEPDLLPSAEKLGSAHVRARELRQELQAVSPHVFSWEQVDAAGANTLVELARRCARDRDTLDMIERGWLGRVRVQLADPMLVGQWHQLMTAAHGEQMQIMQLRSLLAAHLVELPEPVDPQLPRLLTEARTQLGQSGKIGAFARDVKRAVAQCQVDGRVPSTTADIDLCLAHLQIGTVRRSLINRWTYQTAPVHGPALDPNRPEDQLGGRLQELYTLFNWPQVAGETRAALAAAGVRVTQPDTAAGIDELVRILTLLGLRTEERGLAEESARLTALLTQGSKEAQAAPVWRALLAALSRDDFAEWERLVGLVVELHEISNDALRLTELYDRLALAAPTWAAQIAADLKAMGDPVDFPRAWQWRQLDTWVRGPLGGQSAAQLQELLESLAQSRRRLVGELVAELAWRRLADNLGDRHRQALNSYLKAMTRYGKTGGKFAARWLAEIRIALNESKDAVPVWIMPTARALSSFRPELQVPFDVLVIDEASQIGLEALPLLSLARTTIVVGDDKQTSPENVGLDRQAVFDLLDDHLMDIPKYRTLFDPDNSLYDLAQQKFPDVVMLTEHFRSLPEIIAFSNLHAYNGRVIPLRDRPPTPNWAPLGAVKVLDGYRDGDVNEPEAQAVADLVHELCGDPDYAGMDFGVISLLGTSQAKLIWEKLYDRLGQDEMDRRRLRCGEPANFQGDERDVIVLSVVAAADPGKPSGRIYAANGTAAQRRINVAASRARNQMWVVHSVDPDQFPAGDLRAELIRHCKDPGSAREVFEDLAAKCDSEFERDVLRAIQARGYRCVRVQHNVGRYRIDIVVEGPESRLAVECDGDRWHGPDRWHQDRARQEVLERAGWTFERIRGSAFYRDRVAALEPLWRRLDELGVPTGDEWLEVPKRTTLREVEGMPRADRAPEAGDERQAALAADEGEEQDAGEAADEAFAVRESVDPPLMPNISSTGYDERRERLRLVVGIEGVEE